jgi:hypothetical protein
MFNFQVSKERRLQNEALKRQQKSPSRIKNLTQFFNLRI